MKIAGAEIFRYTLTLDRPIPLRDGPLANRTGLLIKLRDSEGNIAWGDGAPLPGFSRETFGDCERSLIKAAGEILAANGDLGEPTSEALPVFQRAEAQSAAYFAVESALRNLAAIAKDTTPWRLHSRYRDATLLLNALLAGDDDAIRVQAERAASMGFRAVKLKVGRENLSDDLRLVKVVREIVGPDMELRLDANQAWDMEDAILFGQAAATANIAYIEEPCKTPFELPAFRAATGIDYAIDESIQRIHDLIQEREKLPDSGPFRDLPIAPIVQGAKAIVWKPSLVHSPELGRFLFHEARPGQTRILVVSGAFESGVGTAALASYAAMFSSPDVPVGLDTYRWITPDLLRERLPMEGGVADLDAIYQAGQAVDESRLERVWPQ